MSRRLTIIIPAGPGERAWHELVLQLVGADASKIVLVLAKGDAGELEAPSHVEVVRSTPGRARQLNVGAAGCATDWLWFLHADSRIGPATLTTAYRFVEDDADAIGYFDLRFLDDGPRWMGLNAVGARLRSRWLGLPFGDQGFLMPRRVFAALGGFDEALASGEDHALVWTARAAGIALRALPAPIHTSARKYAQRGWWATTRHHLWLTVRQARVFSRRTST